MRLTRCAGLNVSRVPKDPRASEFQGIEGPLLTRAFNELASPKIQRISGKMCIQIRAFEELASPKSKGFQGKIYTLPMNWRLQNPKGFRENIYANMTSIKISSSVHGATTLRPPNPLWETSWTIGGAHST